MFVKHILRDILFYFEMHFTFFYYFLLMRSRDDAQATKNFFLLEGRSVKIVKKLFWLFVWKKMMAFLLLIFFSPQEQNTALHGE